MTKTQMNTYLAFLQLIEEGESNGYQVCLENSTIVKDNWTAGNYLEHLGTIERHKQETGISTQYDFITDDHNNILCVIVTLRYPEYKGAHEHTETMRWIVVSRQ